MNENTVYKKQDKYFIGNPNVYGVIVDEQFNFNLSRIIKILTLSEGGTIVINFNTLTSEVKPISPFEHLGVLEKIYNSLMHCCIFPDDYEIVFLQTQEKNFIISIQINSFRYR